MGVQINIDNICARSEGNEKGIATVMINVGIIGCDFVGGVLKAWLEENNKDAKVFVSYQPK